MGAEFYNYEKFVDSNSKRKKDICKYFKYIDKNKSGINSIEVRAILIDKEVYIDDLTKISLKGFLECIKKINLSKKFF